MISEIKQGDIILTAFPYSDLQSKKIRPVLVISNNEFNRYDDFIGVAISTHHSNLFPCIPIGQQDLEEGTILNASSVHPHKIHLLEKKNVQKVVAIAQPKILKKCWEALMQYR